MGIDGARRYRRAALLSLAWALCLAGCAGQYLTVDQDMQAWEPYHADQLYRIGYGDRLQVGVWGHDTLSSEVVVRPDGKIALPLVGEIQSEGLGVDDLREVLNRRYKEYINTPTVTVTVKEIRSQRIYILGEVERPSEYELIGPTDVMQAIAMAGGFTIYAKKNKIQVIRNRGEQKLRFRVNYHQLVDGKHAEQNIPLRAGDVVIVP